MAEKHINMETALVSCNDMTGSNVVIQTKEAKTEKASEGVSQLLGNTARKTFL